MGNKLLFGHKSGKIEVRNVKIPCAIHSNIRILYISDLHFNKYCESRSQHLADIIRMQAPNLLLLGGDYVDTSGGLKALHTLLASVQTHPHVYAVAGNHDYFFGIQKLAALFQEYGVVWIEKSSRQIQLNGLTLQIDGNQIVPEAATAGFRILCLHKPVSLKGMENEYNLALAGHLHGGQCVLWETANGLYPGRWFYRWNILEKQIGDCRYLISRGIGDTLPLRYNCTREVIQVELLTDQSHSLKFSGQFNGV